MLLQRFECCYNYSSCFLCIAKERVLWSRFPVMPANAHLESTLCIYIVNKNTKIYYYLVSLKQPSSLDKNVPLKFILCRTIILDAAPYFKSLTKYSLFQSESSTSFMFDLYLSLSSVYPHNSFFEFAIYNNQVLD